MSCAQHSRGWILNSCRSATSWKAPTSGATTKWPVLAKEAEEKIIGLPGVARVAVELVWDPPWSPERISAQGREKLGME